MHELGITRNIVSIVAEAAGTSTVARVSVKIGEFTAVFPDALLFCFETCTKDTVLENATLDIITVSGRLQCADCSNEFDSKTPYGQCACGSRRLHCLQGEELLIHEMELV
ncbi:hydrogenase maturation nickel metallochaperone HypA [Litorivivens sp.]|uniref:hydrogenase maturation nickel metallochaperone HypA/HybF n=1 Tax=Litorivivens sp. TaxID=2020868 RepID=UPI00356893CA